MPTVESLVNRLNFMVDDTVPFFQAIDLFNQCLEDLSIYSRTGKKVSGSVSLDGSIPYPIDANKIHKIILKKNGWEEEVKSKGTDITFQTFDPSSITFDPPKNETYDYDLYYYATIPAIPTRDNEGNELTEYNFLPSLQERFHSLLPLFAAIRYFENWEGNPNTRDNYRAQYNGLKTEFTQEQFRQEYRNRSRKVRQVRSFE